MRRLWPLGLTLALLAGCADAPTVPQVHPLPEGRLSSDYGVRTVDPVTGAATPNGHHDGYDLAAAAGTPIRASKAGKVVFAGRKGGYGNTVILAHSGGWSTLYGHASRLAVKVGQVVEAGDVIAYVGSTGHSTGPHLHYELRKNGKPVDPGWFSAKPPAPSPKARKAKAMQQVSPPPAEPDLPAHSDAVELDQDAPPVRYPEDPELRSVMLALDGVPLPLEPEPPPTFWERLKIWLAGVLQQVAAFFGARSRG